MSIELFLYSKQLPAKSAIEQIIYPLGFQPVDESIKRPYYYYNYFEEENYESVCGVQLTVSKADPKDREIPRGTRTIFSARTAAGRCYEDIETQNNVIRKLKSVFGGSVYNDGDGRYAYVENYAPHLSAAEKRCGFVYLSFCMNIMRVVIVASKLDKDYIKRKELLGELYKFDKGLVTNNLIVVYLVSILETFLKDLFIAYIEMQPDLLQKIFDRSSKIDFQTLRALLEREKSLAEFEADYYTFQNLKSANLAYSTYLSVNLFNIWDRRRRKIDKKFYKVRDVVEELIELRHKIAHTAYLEPDFDEAQVKKYIEAVETAGKLLAEALEAKGFRIDLDKHL